MGFSKSNFKCTSHLCDDKNYERGRSKCYWKLFTKIKYERQLVTFKKLSKTPKGDYFFNTPKGSVIQKSASVDFNYNVNK